MALSEGSYLPRRCSTPATVSRSLINCPSRVRAGVRGPTRATGSIGATATGTALPTYKLAEAAAGIKISVVEGGYSNVYRIHKLPDGEALERTFEQMLAKDAGDSLERFRFQAREFGGFTTDLDAVAQALKEADDKLSAYSDEEVWDLVEVTVGD